MRDVDAAIAEHLVAPSQWFSVFTDEDIHGVPEKEDARLVAVILSKLNRFSKFFHYRLISKRCKQVIDY